MILTLTGTTWPGNAMKIGPFEGRSYDVPPGAVLVEYIGDPSPFDDPALPMKIALGHYSDDEVVIIREMARRAVKPWPNNRRVILKGGGAGEVKGFSRSYTFGTGQVHKWPIEPGEPGSFYQLMTARDADLLKSTDSGYQFRIHAYDEPRVLVPATDIHIVKKDSIILNRPFSRSVL